MHSKVKIIKMGTNIITTEIEQHQVEVKIIRITSEMIKIKVNIIHTKRDYRYRSQTD